MKRAQEPCETGFSAVTGRERGSWGFRALRMGREPRELLVRPRRD